MSEGNGNGKGRPKGAKNVGFNPKHHAFALALVNPDNNGDYGKAAEIAGYEATEASTLWQIGKQLAYQPKIQAMLREACVAEAMQPGYCEKRMAMMSLSNADAFVGPDGIDIDKAAALGMLCCAKRIKETSWIDKAGIEHKSSTVELYEPLPYLIALAKMRGELTERHEHSFATEETPDDMSDAVILKLATEIAKRRTGMVEANRLAANAGNSGQHAN